MSVIPNYDVEIKDETPAGETHKVKYLVTLSLNNTLVKQNFMKFDIEHNALKPINKFLKELREDSKISVKTRNELADKLEKLLVEKYIELYHQMRSALLESPEKNSK